MEGQRKQDRELGVEVGKADLMPASTQMHKHLDINEYANTQMCQYMLDCHFK